MAVVKINSITTEYEDAQVLRNLDLKVEEGCVYGFSGLNGDGKSTALRILFGLVYPKSGNVLRIEEESFIPNEEE